jgi:hypothetical protein
VPKKDNQTVCTSFGPPKAPDEFRHFAEPSLLLPGENHRDYEVLRQLIVDDIQPQTNIEWLWTLDLIELSWEIMRYRRLKKSILDVHRATAIEAILRRLDGEGMPAEAMPMVDLHARRTASEWRDDRDAASETEARLRRSKFDNIQINAEVFVQARASFEMFDRLTQLAQARRIRLLREISLRREFARRARRVIGTLDGL